MIVLIPSYEPDARLVEIVTRLRGIADWQVVVVDDGSGPAYATWFDAVRALGAEVLSHSVNLGKGRALKTGFAHVLAHHPGADVVCADSDGQHAPEDIRRVAAAVAEGPDLVLGVRRFSGRVPLRSKVGNELTRRLFAMTTGVPIIDTQTGLRGYPHRVLPWLAALPGERFEYELRMLLAAAREHRAIAQVEIATIYLDDNSSSHFRPLHDSLRIYGQLLAFLGSSLLGFAIDALVLALLLWMTGNLAFSVIGARLVSATVNYTINRRLVFAAGGVARVRDSLPRYAALAAALLAANLVLMQSLTALTGSVVVAKIVTEVSLFALSYAVQRTLVFVRRGSREPADAASGEPGAGRGQPAVVRSITR